MATYYLYQGGYAFDAVCLITEKLLPDFHETWWEGVAWAKEENIQFCSRSESWADTQFFFSYFREHCELGHFALAEVCVVWVHF